MAKSSSKGVSNRYVALLRGVNVGGKNKLPMKSLAQIFVDAGCANVRTYIQSGNVVFDAPAAVAKKAPKAVTTEISRQFGFNAPVVMRSAAEWQQTIAANPFAGRKVEPTSLHVVFLADCPSISRVAQLDRQRSPGDEFEVVGGAIYMCLSNGAAGTKLTNAYFDRVLETISTGRNWRSVMAIAAMLE
ncbi:MAG: DUF1697 domain-containing protein [Phycisphaerales bacterium]|nr:DUF1697 domain-containing protein [Phycisphaerales bacterium]